MLFSSTNYESNESSFLEISSFRLFYVYANCDRIVTTFCLFRRKVETKRSKRTILLMKKRLWNVSSITFFKPYPITHHCTSFDFCGLVLFLFIKIKAKSRKNFPHKFISTTYPSLFKNGF